MTTKYSHQKYALAIEFFQLAPGFSVFLVHKWVSPVCEPASGFWHLHQLNFAMQTHVLELETVERFFVRWRLRFRRLRSFLYLL